MGGRLLVGFILLWFFATILQHIVWGNNFAEEGTNVLNTVLGLKVGSVRDALTLPFTIPGWIVNLVSMLTWNFSWLQGDLWYLRAVFAIISGWAVYTIVAMFVNAVMGIFN